MNLNAVLDKYINKILDEEFISQNELRIHYEYHVLGTRPPLEFLRGEARFPQSRFPDMDSYEDAADEFAALWKEAGPSYFNRDEETCLADLNTLQIGDIIGFKGTGFNKSAKEPELCYTLFKIVDKYRGEVVVFVPNFPHLPRKKKENKIITYFLTSREGFYDFMKLHYEGELPLNQDYIVDLEDSSNNTNVNSNNKLAKKQAEREKADRRKQNRNNKYKKQRR